MGTDTQVSVILHQAHYLLNNYPNVICHQGISFVCACVCVCVRACALFCAISCVCVFVVSVVFNHSRAFLLGLFCVSELT